MADSVMKPLLPRVGVTCYLVADRDEPAPAHVPVDRHQPGGAEQGDDEQAEGDPARQPRLHRGRRRGDADAAPPTQVPHGDRIFREGRQRTEGGRRQLVRAEHDREHAAAQARYAPTV